MRFQATTFDDLIRHYSFLSHTDFWAVAQTSDSEEYDIYYVDKETRYYEYLASDTISTGNQVIKMIFEKVGLC